MKLITKKGAKDYYDYLIGLYGIDPKIIYVRPVTGLPDNLMKDSVWVPYINNTTGNERFYIHLCGSVIDGFYHHKSRKFYYGQDLKQFGSDLKGYDKWLARFREADPKILLRIEDFRESFSIIPYVNDYNLNDHYKQPVLLTMENRKDCRVYYPKLKDIGFQQYMDAKTIYLLITDWLSPKDVIPKPIDDKTKIINHGFDIKTSFRNTK